VSAPAVSPAASAKIAAFGFLCAFGVVAIHAGLPAPADPSAADWWVYRLTAGTFGRLAVPFYFAAAGFFLARHAGERGWWKREMAKRAKTLAVPFCFWLLAWDGFAVAFQLVANRRAGAAAWAALPSGWDALSFFGLHPCRAPFDMPLWFLRSLLLFAAAAPLLFGLVRRFGPAFLALLHLLAVGSVSGCLPAWAEGVAEWSVPPQGLFFFSAGAWLALGDRRPPSGVLAVCLGVLGFSGLVLSFWMLARGMAGAAAVHAAFLPAALPGAWRAMPSVRWPAWLTGCTFAVYVLHVFVVRLLACGLYGAAGTGVLLFKYAAASGLSLAAALVLRRFFPRFSAFAFGGR